ncbi:MAG TPA: metallophosphoesterase [Planctomycetota bacterium]|nr:metallophosphoesterase [Planctomycetota bacterium]
MILFVAIVQTILFLAHGLLWATSAAFLDGRSTGLLVALGAVVALLSLTFVPATILAFRSRRAWVKVLYRGAAVWLGLLNYLFFGALLAWGVEGVNRLMGEPIGRPTIGAGILVLALLASLAAFIQSGRVRVVTLPVSLPNLPESWKGRRMAVLSDVHLGHVRGAAFLRRLVGRIAEEKPDLVVVPGDLYDGTSVDAEELARPWKDLSAPLGVYFVTGNHEEFHDASRFTQTLAAAGVRTLQNEKVHLDGVQIVGIHDGDHRNPERLGSLLRGLRLDRSTPSILLAHSPIHLGIAEQAGLSLQISGHTHGGQFFPWTWVVDRVYGAFARGLHALGSLQVLTTVGAGTWGPPMRLGSRPELVMVRFA